MSALAASTAFNVVSAMESDNLLLSIVAAALVPLVTSALYKFFDKVWPKWVHRFILRCLFHREVSAVQSESTSNRSEDSSMVESDVLIDILLHYIGHLTSLALGNDDGMGTESDKHIIPPRLEALQYAEYSYASRPQRKESQQAQLAESTSSQLAHVLQRFFYVATIPSENVALEVEPGLMVRYIKLSQTLRQARLGTAQRRQHDLKDPTAQKATRAEHYLFTDLLNQLQECNGETSASKAKSGLLGSLFDVSSDDEDNDDEDPEASSSTENNEDTEDIPDAVPRQIIFQCHELKASERVRYLLLRRRRAQLGLDAAAESATDDELTSSRSRIDAFVQRAREWFIDNLHASNNSCRFLYYPACTELEAAVKANPNAAAGNSDDNDIGRGGVGPSGERAMDVQRYLLPQIGSKTFQTLFFSQKAEVEALLESFQTRSGKYAIPGMAHRLTMLVHGPPGTGKTSLVKAMANKLGRHVVVVPLGAMQTTAALADWMNEAHVNCINEQTLCVYADSEYSDDDFDLCDGRKAKLLPSEVIYLLEDIDAVDMADITAPDRPAAADTAATTSGASAAAAVAAATPAASVASPDSSTSSKDDADAESLDSAAREEQRRLRREQFFEALLAEFMKDRLTVSGVLHVLNGTVAPAGRVVVMTTNHPERLDPRLLQPSVVNLKVNMNNMDATRALELVRYYFSEAITAEEGEQIKTLCDGLSASTGKVNPAQLEQLCAECDTVSQVIKRLESKDWAYSSITY